MKLTSPAFADGERIPDRFTCQGRDLSPALAWTAAPAGTRSLALILDDPDAPRGTFTHWVAWGIAPDATGIAEGERAPVEGLTDFGRPGYGGPCPPRGHGIHHYGFRLYALDTPSSLPGGAPREALEAAMEGHVLAVAALTGVFDRT